MNLSFKVRGTDTIMNPLNKFEMEDGNVVVIYQGSRGQYPELDFIVKYKKNDTRLRTPSHTHWVTDLVIKSHFDKKLTLELVNDFIKIYFLSKPFQLKIDRDNYKLIYPKLLSEKYKNLDSKGGISVEMLTTFIELFSICEKRTENAFMFKKTLEICKEYLEGKKDYYQIISYSKRV